MLSTPLVDVRTLQDWLAAPVVLLDCRFDLNAPAAGRDAYRAGHLPGAHYLDLNEDLAGPVSRESGRHPLPSSDTLMRRLRALGVARDVPVVVYDAANGSIAARAWWLLRWLGIARVAVLDGGFQAWVSAGGALETGSSDIGAAATSGSLPERTSSMAVADVDEVTRALRDPARRLIDARAPERYAGAAEPLDPVAGHIPGALNHPFTRNLGENGHFLPATELRNRWLERLGGAAPEMAVLMCGSGVTACHNLLALELAGLPGAKLYPGSWSEWIRDPERPVARGHAP